MKTQEIQSVERFIDHFYKYETFVFFVVIATSVLLSCSCMVILAWLDLNEVFGIPNVSLGVLINLFVSIAIGIAFARGLCLSIINGKNNASLPYALLKQLIIAAFFLFPISAFFVAKEEQTLLLHTAYVLSAIDTAGFCVFILWMLRKHRDALSMLLEQRNAQLHQEKIS